MIVGFDNAEDAGVVAFAPDRALVQTLDFFTPIVDDPWEFGAIAAVNALSDVYAMGGVPLCAMNILCFPEGKLGEDVLRLILQGGRDKCAEAGAMLVGGHSVKDDELKFGLSVTGTVHPDGVWLNHGARPGDVLVLTKKIGTGLFTTARKRSAIEEEALAEVKASMLLLNKQARDFAADLDVHACTDITGNGIAGHGWEMARGSGVVVRFSFAQLPLFAGAVELAARGMSPGGAKTTRKFLGDNLVFQDLGENEQLIAVDPQTSGGLLFALAPADAETLVGRLRAAGLTGAVVGRVDEGPPSVVFSP
jgi:selenide,water dikinase